MQNCVQQAQVAPHDAFRQVGSLPNGDKLLLNPEDNFVYQLDQVRNILLNRFCSLELWHSTYQQCSSQWGK